MLPMIKYESPAMHLAAKQSGNVTPPQLAVPVVPEILQTSGNYELDIEMNDCIIECFESGSDEGFGIFLQLVLSENVPINYQHPETGHTGLMAAAYHGNMEITEQLIKFGSDPGLRSKDNYSAYDFACSQQHIHVAQYLQVYLY